ncbi:MAG TPA: PilX N-terminal domain-containing pilus assembly protein [Fluviicoccus sp.]|nr:PilX N-terminal domain-containing pilus assembly protein [Fluviicoccus sp.]
MIPIGSRRQRGMTLIVVLLVLIVMTLLGISAMRMGLSSLSVATNSQVGNLLYESADAGLFHLERTAMQNVTAALQPGGVLATNSEDVFCLKPKSGSVALVAGRCDSAQAGDFMSSRNAALTQVHVINKGSFDEFSQNATMLIGSDSSIRQSTKIEVTVASTSVLPGFGSATTGTINGCLANTGDDSRRSGAGADSYEVADPAVTTVSECLSANGGVYSTLLEDFEITNERK